MGTALLIAKVFHWSGAYLQAADLTKISYTIYELDPTDPDDRSTTVKNHDDVEIQAADVIYDTPQTDASATDYNFEFIPDVTTHPAFAKPGTTYLVECIFELTDDQPKIAQFKVKAQ